MRRRIVVEGVFLLVVLTLVGFGRGAPGVHPAAAAAPAAIADGQIFDVTLHTEPYTAPPSGRLGAKPCTEAERDRLEQMTLQFAFSRDAGGTLALSVSGTWLAGPAALGADTLPVQETGGAAAFSGTVHPLFGVSLDLAGKLSASSDAAGGSATALTLMGVTGVYTRVPGDVIMSCDFQASGTGARDTTPPTPFFGSRCSDTGGGSAGCLLLADSSVTLWFSELVPLDAVAAHLSASDQDGTAIPLTVDTGAASEPHNWLGISAFWPLGKQVTLTLSPGVADRAGNAVTELIGAPYFVVEDPGDLDEAGNSDFETGDLAGYSVHTLTDYVQSAAGEDPARYLVSRQPGTQVEVITQAAGAVSPTEGQYMAIADLGGRCAAGEISLTSRFTVPDGATWLALDDNLLRARRFDSGFVSLSRPLVGATVQTPTEMRHATQPQPRTTDMLPIDDELDQSGWQELRIPVDGLAGQEVVLTLRLRPSIVLPPPPSCISASLLIDNLHFE